MTTTTPTRRAPPWSPWRPRPDATPQGLPARPRPGAVAAIKTVHTLAWASIESCVLYVLQAGLAGRTDKRVGIATAVVVGESLVFAANGFRCPLTELAERCGAERGSVTDIYLPKRFAENIPAIHAPLLILMAYLHARNLRRSHTPAAGTGRRGSDTPRVDRTELRAPLPRPARPSGSGRGATLRRDTG